MIRQIDLFYGTGTHYDNNCWVYRGALWLSARTASESTIKRLKMMVSKSISRSDRAPERSFILYAQTGSHHTLCDGVHINSERRCRKITGIGDFAALSAF